MFVCVQNYLREQPDNFSSHNVVEEVLAYLHAIQWVTNPTSNKPEWNIDATHVDNCCQVSVI